MKIELKVLNKMFYEQKFLPSYATSGSAGVDLVCTQDVGIGPGQVIKIPTGLAIWIGSNDLHRNQHVGIMGMIVPRSGLGNRGLILANTVGIIDEDYQGELIVSAWNRNNRSDISERLCLHAGERFAQLVLVPVIKAEWDVVEEFSNNTTRGAGGFGSTGV